MTEDKTRADEIMDCVACYLQLKKTDLEEMIKNMSELTGVELVALKYVRSMFDDYKFMADYLDRTGGKPVQKIITKDITDRNKARELSDDELNSRLRASGVDPQTGLPFRETFTQPAG